MRRTIEQAQAEIMQNKARHDAAAGKRRRALKTAVIPALSAAAVFALVFGFAILPAIKKGRAGNTALVTEETDQYASAATAAPGDAPESVGDPFGGGGDAGNAGAAFDPTDGPGAWICGTPILEGGFYEPGDAATYGDTPGGGILVLWDGDEKVNFYIDRERAGQMYACIRMLEPTGGAELPDDELAEYVIALDFGNRTLRCISYSDGTFLINQDTVCTAGESVAGELMSLVNEAQN